MKSRKIIAKAKKKLKDTIAYNGKEIYLLLNNWQFPNFSKDEEYRIKIKDIYEKGSRFEINVYGYYEDEPVIIGNRYIWEIRIALDNSVYFFDGEEEFDYDELTVEELGRISDLLEIKLISKK